MRKVVSWIIRVMCVYFVLEIAANLPYPPFASVSALLGHAAKEAHGTAPMLLYGIISFLAVLGVLLASDRIAGWIVRDAVQFTLVPPEMLNQALMRIGVATIGLYLALSNLHLLVVSIIAERCSVAEGIMYEQVLRRENGGSGIFDVYLCYYNDIVAHAAMFALGMLLCILSLPLAGLICRLLLRNDRRVRVDDP